MDWPVASNFEEIMKNTTVKLFAVLALALSAAPAISAETPATFDAKKCTVEYPKASLMNEEQGTTTASFHVSADGTVTDSKLEKSSGFKSLDKAALKGFSACKFKPGTKDGAPAATWTRVEYSWSLS